MKERDQKSGKAIRAQGAGAIPEPFAIVYPAWKRRFYAAKCYAEAMVFDALCAYANGDSDECFPTLPTLAKWSGYDERTVRRALRGLESFGAITTKVGGMRGSVRTASTYVIKPPPEAYEVKCAEKRDLLAALVKDIAACGIAFQFDGPTVCLVGVPVSPGDPTQPISQATADHYRALLRPHMRGLPWCVVRATIDDAGASPKSVAKGYRRRKQAGGESSESTG